MAGYMNRLNGHIYDFQHKSGVDGLANGMFVKIDTNGEVILTAADCDTKLKVVEKTTLWRKDARLALTKSSSWRTSGKFTKTQASTTQRNTPLTRATMSAGIGR